MLNPIVRLNIDSEIYIIDLEEVVFVGTNFDEETLTIHTNSGSIIDIPVKGVSLAATIEDIYAKMRKLKEDKIEFLDNIS